MLRDSRMEIEQLRAFFLLTAHNNFNNTIYIFEKLKVESLFLFSIFVADRNEIYGAIFWLSLC